MGNLVEKIKRNHILMMALCCVIPIVALIAAVYLFGLSKIYLTWFVILLCPIMHLFMMRDMHKGHKEEGEEGAGISRKTQDAKSPDKKERGGCH